ncbi:ABC transporter substrate-binding protein, partial [Suttonella ornithocola]
MPKTVIKTLSAALLLAISTTSLAEMVFNRGNGSEPHSIDPQIAEGVPSSHIQRDLFEGLVAEDSKGELVPGVAKNWDVSDDGKTYTFHLRDTKWSDGSPFTA